MKGIALESKELSIEIIFIKFEHLSQKLIIFYVKKSNISTHLYGCNFFILHPNHEWMKGIALES